jgi:hypothetical protein
MTIPSEQSNTLKLILETVILQQLGSCLVIALQQHGYKSILNAMALAHWEIETLQWMDGSKPKDIIGSGHHSNVITLPDFVLSLHPSPVSMMTSNWLALTQEHLCKLQSFIHYRLLCNKAPRPEHTLLLSRMVSSIANGEPMMYLSCLTPMSLKLP